MSENNDTLPIQTAEGESLSHKPRTCAENSALFPKQHQVFVSSSNVLLSKLCPLQQPLLRI